MSDILHRVGVKASPEKVFPLLNDFQKTVAWSPFEKDPAIKRKFSGPAVGKGSVYEFDGNSDVGAGRLEIIESVPSQKVTLKLDFIRPMEGSNIVEYTLMPKDGATQMTWAIHGPTPFVSKIMCIFFDMDKMVGGEFEKGFANLKAMAEK